MPIDPLLLDLLADPVDHTPLGWDGRANLLNEGRAVTYPVLDGVPALVGDDRSSAALADAGHQVRSFDGVADWYAAVMQDPDAHGAMTRRANELLAARLVGVTGVVLDVACGTGLSPRWLSSDRYRLVGVGISADQLRLARSRLPVVQGDAGALPFRDGVFDAVVTAYSAAPDLEAAAGEAFRVLRDGGRYVQVTVHPVLNGSWSSVEPDGSVRVADFGQHYRHRDECSSSSDLHFQRYEHFDGDCPGQ